MWGHQRRKGNSVATNEAGSRGGADERDVSRRHFLGVAGAAGSAAALARMTGAKARSARPGGTPSWPTAWLIARSGFDNLNNTQLGGDPTVCQNAFNQGTTWFSAPYTGGSFPAAPIPSGYTGTAVLKFEAYDDPIGGTGLRQAIAAGLPSWVQAVQYDSEEWSATPEIEQGAWLYNSFPNKSYAKKFCEDAHSYTPTLKVVLTPGNDLCNNAPNTAYPNHLPQYPLQSGETNYEAYERYALESEAQWLNSGDMYEYQAQILELDITQTTNTYKDVTSTVATKVGTVSSGVIMMAGLGRTAKDWDGATGTQLHTAASSVSSIVAGFWPNVDANATRVGYMISCLKLLGF